MGRFLNDMQIADLRCIQVNKGGMKYELLLSFQSALDSNQVKSKCPNRTASMCDLDQNKEAMETRSSDSKVKLIRPRTSCAVDMKKKVESWSLLVNNSSNRFSQSSLDPNFLSLKKFCNARKWGNHLVSGTDYMVNALKLPDQAPRVFSESLQTCVAWRCPDGIQHLFCWHILIVSGQSLVSNGPVVDSRDMNLVFGHTEATHNKLFLSSST
ncbi:hypothetical protein TNCV_4293481 [Trichonephila clavipes]|uniref:Uncharacterized protein n=1 Tax=Trichonephila clavipes TaxID=2585209 RepID=A0A8X6V057_TRICX|nr:hypothetical protein TNCV_4293481 [Trichonephila clavipes]